MSLRHPLSVTQGLFFFFFVSFFCLFMADYYFFKLHSKLQRKTEALLTLTHLEMLPDMRTLPPLLVLRVLIAPLILLLKWSLPDIFPKYQGLIVFTHSMALIMMVLLRGDRLFGKVEFYSQISCDFSVTSDVMWSLISALPAAPAVPGPARQYFCLPPPLPPSTDGPPAAALSPAAPGAASSA